MVRLPLFFRLPSKLRRRARRRRMETLALIAVVGLLLVAPFYIVYRPPQLVIRYFQRRWPDVLWEVSTSEKIVALTIDDAPSSHTAEILELLEANGATATFFVIGSQVDGREDALRQIVRAGSELGNHAMHDEPSRSLSNADLRDQIDTVREHIRTAYDAEAKDEPAHYFRPGSGFFSDRMRALVDSLGYRLVLGSIYPHDPQIKYASINSRHILSMLRPGAIIICHDRRSWTAPMLRQVLPEIKRRGYKIVSVTGLLEMAKQGAEEKGD